MKKLFVMAAALAAIWSCTKEINFPESPKSATHRMTVNTGAPTKTVINEVTGGYSVLWQSGDALGVYEVANNTPSATKSVSDPLDDGGSAGSFNFAFTGSQSGPFNYVFVSPESALGMDGGNYYVTLPKDQSFGTSSFDRNADVLVSELVSAAERPSSVNARFARLGATAKMTLVAPATTEKLRRVTFSTTEGFLAGRYEINPVNGALSSLEGSSKEIVLTPALVTEYTGSLDIWFRLADITLTDNFSVTVETDAKTYVKNVNLGGNSVEFANGRLTTFTVDMSGIAGTDSWDVIDWAYIGHTNADSYMAWTQAASYSSAEYAGKTSKSREGGTGPYYFRLRTTEKDCSVVTTQSGGYVQAVKITLPVSASARTLYVYASNTAYTSTTDVFDNDKSKWGVRVGQVSNSSTEEVTQTIWLRDAYRYVAFKSSDSMLIQELRIKWEAYPPYTQSSGDAVQIEGLLEMPAPFDKAAMSGTTTSSLNDIYTITHSALMNGTVQRNYTMMYDPEMFASYWVAYPLCADHITSGRTDSWAFDPDVPSSKQTRLDLGAYGVNYSAGAYANNYYARGHQIPNADRNNVAAMQAQTYYSTNITPQLQHGLNGHAWKYLEEAVRGAIPTGDTLYVVTGAAFRKRGGTETINYITNQHDNKSLPVPNYYWKALLKVQRDGSGGITGACTIGFWLEHRDDYASDGWQQCNVSVDQIESWTGFNLFANLSAELQTESETNTSWDTFKSYQ